MSEPLLAVDARTLVVVSFASSILMAAVLWFVFAGRFRDGLARWTQSLWVQALAWLLIALRGAIPDPVSIAAAHGLLALGWALQFMAVLEFQRRRAPAALMWVPAAIVFALFFVLLDDLRLRVMLGSALYGGFFLGIAGAALGRKPEFGLRAHGLFAGGYVLAALALLLQSLGAWAWPATFATLSPDDQGLLFFVAYMLVVSSSLAYLLMHRERADE